MSSSAFFIEAAAKTVRVVGWAKAGEKADPLRRTKAAKRPARRCMMTLRACSRRAICARKSGVGRHGRERRKRRSADPGDLRSIGIFASKNNNRLGVWVKSQVLKGA